MATITNLSQCCVSVAGRNSRKEMVAVGLDPRLDKDNKVNPGSSKIVDDILAKSWAERASRMIEQKAVTIKYGDAVPIEDPRFESRETDARDVEPEKPGKIRAAHDVKPHWRSVVVQINKTTDLDELEQYMTDERKAVSDAAERRFAELEGE